MKITDSRFKEIEKELNVQFYKVDSITLVKGENGSFVQFPQLRFNNVKNYPYLAGVDGTTEFCHFKPNLPKEKGVYLWVVDDEIIYLGEAVDLRSRFVTGYGHISPRNCFKGGQSTNVKMNRVALNYYKQGKTIDIYIILTEKHKEVELYLLNRINTKYNVQNNWCKKRKSKKEEAGKEEEEKNLL